jgi:hypothetical protein
MCEIYLILYPFLVKKIQLHYLFFVNMKNPCPKFPVIFNAEEIKMRVLVKSCFYLSTEIYEPTCLAAVVVLSLDVCSNALAALTPILETSFRLSLVF